MDAVREAGRPAPRRTRPADRKARILTAAAELFHRDGYHAVGIEDIAAAVGVSGPAVYRHFESKTVILARVVGAAFDTLETALIQGLDTTAGGGPGNGDSGPDDGDSVLGDGDSVLGDGGPGDGDGGLDRLLAALVTVLLDRRDLGVMWQREVRHLPEAERLAVRQRFRALAARVADAIATARPELSGHDADLLAWAVIAFCASPSHHRVTMARARFESLLRQAGARLCQTSALPARSDSARSATAGPVTAEVPASRPEVILAVAPRLFAESGYQAVTIEDIGAAAGIAGPSVYHHFASKADILVATIQRSVECLRRSLFRAVDTSDAPYPALETALRSYVDIVIDRSELISVAVTEWPYLPEAERRVAQRFLSDYIGEWVRLLRAVDPALAEPEARVLVRGMMTLVNDLVRTPHLRRRADLGDVLVALCLATVSRRAPDM